MSRALICHLILLFGSAVAGARIANAEVCPPVGEINAGIPRDYHSDGAPTYAATVSEWSHAEYSPHRERLFCHYTSSKRGDWSIYIIVGDISDELRRSPTWVDGRIGAVWKEGQPYFVCTSKRYLCEFSVPKQ